MDCLIKAFAVAAADAPRTKLRIAGRGPERARLEALAREVGAERNIEFLGWIEPEDVERELSSAWLLVAPSLWAEPLGLVAREAIVSGVPVLASVSGGFAETVEEGVTGMLVPNGDIEALANGIRAVITERQFPRGLSPDAVGAVGARHDMGAHVTRMRAIFREVAGAAS